VQYLALSADKADRASNTLSVLLKLVSNDNNILIPAISMEKSPYMIGFNWFCCGVFYLFTGHGKF
jgi:hypothetical protein